ncbi:MAG: FG-GAP repeat protein [Myxococcales bacterium]|nr:FG-GAP repeat protein [Myxococcales bacterium]
MTPALSHLPLAIALSLTIAPTARATPGAFAEADVVVLAQIDGDGGFGWAVSEVADVDGDGVMEALVSAPFNDEGGDKAGAIYLYSGAGGALLFAAKGEPGDNLGYGIADAGDVDDDGVPDLIAGAPGVGGGRALVYSGADGSLLLTLASEADGASFGAAVAAAGDVDGDGHGDLLVGAPSDASAGADAGRVHLFAGIDGATIWIRDGAAGSMLGAGTAPRGDGDDDGVPDLVVGAPRGRRFGPRPLGADGADLYPPSSPIPAARCSGNSSSPASAISTATGSPRSTAATTATPPGARGAARPTSGRAPTASASSPSTTAPPATAAAAVVGPATPISTGSPTSPSAATTRPTATSPTRAMSRSTPAATARSCGRSTGPRPASSSASTSSRSGT